MPGLLKVVAFLAASGPGFVSAGVKKWVSPEYKQIFQNPLPIPPIKPVTQTYTSPNGTVIDYYEVKVEPFTQQVYPGLKPARLVGYDGVSPGPTFMMRKGRQAVVRFINSGGDRPSSIHLHGSYSRAPFDGWAEDTIGVGEYKDYYYPNEQNARTLWYHDHAIDHTAENAYMGQAGFYILHDDEELNTPGLPQGQYDVPLALNSKQYNSDGTLWGPEANNEEVSVYGDVIQVNGQPWPYLEVEPRLYRFRLLNAAVSRSFRLSFEDAAKANTKIPFKVVGSDTGLNLDAVDTSDIYISMAERWEVLVDFSKFAGKNITMKNARDVGADDDYTATDRVMQFRVAQTATSQQQGVLPSPLRNVNFPPAKSGVDRKFKFERSNGHWKVNGVSWADGPEARVIAKPKRGAVEVWELTNSAGGWTHPVHIHLIDFQVISRSGGDRSSVMPYEKVALKDVVWLSKGETVRVIARYAPWDGLYMFHCHNLIHEDHEMMAAMDVKALEDFGYSETTRFLDPMEETYRAKPYPPSGSVEDKLAFFAGLDAYNGGKVEKALVEYWKGKGQKREVKWIG